LLGILLCAAQDSPLRWLHWPGRLFCSLHRNTPLLVQVLLWYFGAGGLLPDAAMQWLNTPHQWAAAGLQPGLALVRMAGRLAGAVAVFRQLHQRRTGRRAEYRGPGKGWRRGPGHE
jgi:ABC-type amino acid transport system permease subunit